MTLKQEQKERLRVLLDSIFQRDSIEVKNNRIYIGSQSINIPKSNNIRVSSLNRKFLSR